MKTKIKKLKYLSSRAYTTSNMASKTSNTAITPSTTPSIQDKWVINLSKKELAPEERSLLQKGPKFVVTPTTIPVKEYTSTTTVAALQASEPNGVEWEASTMIPIEFLTPTPINQYIQTSYKQNI